LFDISPSTRNPRALQNDLTGRQSRETTIIRGEDIGTGWRVVDEDDVVSEHARRALRRATLDADAPDTDASIG
jgi:hypothetical protein